MMNVFQVQFILVCAEPESTAEDMTCFLKDYWQNAQGEKENTENSDSK